MPTTRTLDLLERVLDALDEGRGIALSVIGPYGSGKSSAVLFLRALFSEQSGDAAKIARRKLGGVSAELSKRVGMTLRRLGCASRGLGTAFATAAREPLSATLLRALSGGQLLPTQHRKRHITVASDVLRLFEERTRRGSLLLVVDEFGKNLEHFGEDPAASDLFALQQIAEQVVASSKAPTIFITLQHLAFDEYLSLSTPQAQKEWAKVQGRFADFSFAESPRQIRKLIAAALAGSPSRSAPISSILVDAHVAELARLGFEDMGEEAVSSAWPLHPLALLALPDLCARFAQNERTLFSFLRSDDPAALPRFRPGEAPLNRFLLGLDHLFDYFVESARSQLMAARGARRWLEVETRISDATGLSSATELAVLKTVGILNLITAGGTVRASQAAIEYACLDDPAAKVQRRRVRTALDSLVAAGLLTYRTFADEYRIWGGSDFDLSGAFERARMDISQISLAALLQQCRPRLPVVEGRFSARTGSLRAFECTYVDDAERLAQLQPSDPAYDGVVAFWVAAAPPPSHVRNDGSRPVVMVRSTETPEVRRTAIELASFQRVLDNSQQLETDPVAKRELIERLALAQMRLDEAVWKAFERGAMNRITRVTATGISDVAPGRLSTVVSDIAQLVYTDTPRIANEVINRQQLTTQGASARRTLMQAMLAHAGDEDLGIQGYGPERTIYVALLKSAGLHRLRDGEWEFGRPYPESELASIWATLESSIESTRFRKLSVDDLFARLSGPPFGMRHGPLPVIFTAFLLAGADDTALYEHGTYQPNLTPELLERLAKNPGNFEVRSFAARQGARLSVVNEAIEQFRLPRAVGGRPSTLVTVVRSMLNTLRSLEDYSWHTRNLSVPALAVRNALIEAREPDELLFVALPQAVGLQPIGTEPGPNCPDASALVGPLKAALFELKGAFPSLLNRMQTTMARLVAVDEDQLRGVLRRRSEHLIPRATGHLVSFLIAASDDMNSSNDWLQRLATAVVGKAPKVWRDEDEIAFEARVRECVGGMHRLEFLFGDAAPNPADTYRICLTLGDGTERVFVGSNTLNAPAISELTTRTIAEATKAGHGGPAALLKALIEELGQEPVSATHSASSGAR